VQVSSLYKEPRAMVMQPGESITVHNPSGGPHFMITCNKDGTLVVRDLDSGVVLTRQGSIIVNTNGVVTTYICNGSVANE
jgi:hypothetical protein